MAKIRITKHESEIEGAVQESVVKPFGTSAHIPISRRHLGKVVHIVIPEEPEYCWILSDKEKTEALEACSKILEKEDSKMSSYRSKMANSIKDARFELQDLYAVVETLKKSPKHRSLAEKIRKAYNL
jgi:putative transposon-encoded protein